MKAKISMAISLIFFMGVFNFALLDQARCAHWEWQNPIPTGNNLEDVWRSPTGNDVFAVGGNGTILYSDGSTWVSMDSGVQTDLYGVWGTSSSDVFAVGLSGIILHYDGSAWTQQNSTTTAYLYAVWGSSANNVYAVGTSGTIVSYDGSNWSTMTTPLTTPTLRGVWGDSGFGDVYAVGSNGTIWRYFDGTWIEMDSGTTTFLYGIWGTSNTDMYAVGSGGTILRYIVGPTSEWLPMTPVPSTTITLYSIWGIGTDVFVAGSSGTIWRYVVGVGWGAMTSGTTASLTGISGSAVNDVYAVGTNGSILQYNGSAWAPFAASSVTSVTLNDIWGSSATDIFAVGYTGTILRSDGTIWSQEVSNTVENLEAVWGSSGSDVFAVGWNGTVTHYNGSNWTATTEAAVRLNDVWGSSDSDVFAVGNTGTILHWNGSAWTTMTSGTVENLNGVWGFSSSDVYAVGTFDGDLGMGTVLHYDGSVWSQVLNIPINDELFDIWGSGPGNIYAVGYGGAVMHYDGTVWRQIESMGYDLEAIWGTVADDVYILDGVDLFHYDGYVWSPVSMPINSANGIWGSSADDVYLVTGQGGIVNYSVDTYYVDINRPNNTGDGGTPTTAWKNLHYAVDQINNMPAGNYRLDVATGTYSLLDGEADTNITINQDNVLLQGHAGTLLDYGETPCNETAWSFGVIIDASEVVLRDLEISRFRCDGNPGIRVVSGTNSRIEACDVTDNDYGIHVSDPAADTAIVACDLSLNDTALKSDDAGLIVIGNKIYENGTGLDLTNDTGNISLDVFNNLFYGTTSAHAKGIIVDANGGAATLTTYHNTINGILNGIQVNYDQGNASLFGNFKFNIIANADVGLAVDNGQGGVFAWSDYNVVFNCTTPFSFVNQGSNDRIDDPLFVNPGGFDFHLQEASPAVDFIPVGVSDPIYQDLEGTYRPFETGHDMGAYEYHGSADVDSDGDGVLDSQDGCPLDSDKTDPGQCGCGAIDADADEDGLADCVDVYPDNTDNRPTQVLPTDGDIIPAGVDVTLTSTGFQPAGTVTHTLTYWEVWRTDNNEMITGIPTTDLTETTLVTGLFSEGLHYTWRVGYEDSETQVSWSPERTFIIGTSETDDTVDITSGTNVTDYKMVSFVQWPDDPRAEVVFGDELTGDYDGNYRIGTYNADRGAYDEYGTGRLMVVPGRGYWFLAREGLGTVVEGVPVSLSAGLYVVLDYNPNTQDGWNMVGPPNGADYLWGDVEVVVDDGEALTGVGTVQSLPDDNPYIDRKLWRWEGGAYAHDTPETDSSQVMAAYEGYWVKTKQANVYLRFDTDTQILSLGQSDTLLARTWHKASTLLSILDIFSQEAVADNDTPPMPMGGLDDNTVDPVFQGCFIEITNDFDLF